jgi:hypothetical protein
MFVSLNFMNEKEKKKERERSQSTKLCNVLIEFELKGYKPHKYSNQPSFFGPTKGTDTVFYYHNRTNSLWTKIYYHPK